MHLAKWIFLATISLVIIALFALLHLLFVYFTTSNFEFLSANLPLPVEMSRSLPAAPFAPKDGDYSGINSSVLGLKLQFPSVSVPNLRNQLTYYGTNERPDVIQQTLPLQFALPGSRETFSIEPEKPLYLLFDKEFRPSEQNTPTNLWFTAEKKEAAANLSVRVRDLNGGIVDQPDELANFELKEQDYARSTRENWEIGKWRVDASILARQRARWYGQDQFINSFGGREYSNIENREWIEFGEKEETYGIYLGIGDCAIWRNNRWERVELGEETKQYPILCPKSIEERTMRLDLWNLEGKGKIAIRLLRTIEPWSPEAVLREFKYVATRTLSQFIFEIKGKRMTLMPGDWLLRGEEEWYKLTTQSEIDEFVNRVYTGVLFTFDEVVENTEGDAPLLKGKLFSPSRSNVFDVELPLEVEGVENTRRSSTTRDTQRVSESDQPSNFLEIKRSPFPRPSNSGEKKSSRAESPNL